MLQYIKQKINCNNKQSTPPKKLTQITPEILNNAEDELRESVASGVFGVGRKSKAKLNNASEPFGTSALEIPHSHIDSRILIRRRMSSRSCIPIKRINSLALIQNTFTFQHNNILLSESEQTAIHKIMKRYPQLFAKIDDALATITRKGRVELHDIPQIVYMIYHILLPNKYITSENALNIIIFVVETILDSITYPLSTLENDIVAKQTVLNNSFALLEAKLPEPEPRRFFGWLGEKGAAASVSTFG